jgi:hypothetical protein
MYFIGIDVGAKGAIAVIDALLDVVVLEDLSPEPLESARIIKIAIDKYNFPETMCYIEEVGAAPGNGTVSMFKFGQQYGCCIGILSGCGVKFEALRPQKWQKGVLVVPSSITTDRKKAIKQTSIEKAKRLFPKADIGRKDGRSDALLIAFKCYLDFFESFKQSSKPF